jgi:hypothetical protein
MQILLISGLGARNGGVSKQNPAHRPLDGAEGGFPVSEADLRAGRVDVDVDQPGGISMNRSPGYRPTISKV